jgi:hypothetical protein
VNLRDERVYPVADALLARRVPLIFTTGYDAIAVPDVYAHVVRCEKPVNKTALMRELSHMLMRRV